MSALAYYYSLLETQGEEFTSRIHNNWSMINTGNHTLKDLRRLLKSGLRFLSRKLRNFIVSTFERKFRDYPLLEDYLQQDIRALTGTTVAVIKTLQAVNSPKDLPWYVRVGLL